MSAIELVYFRGDSYSTVFTIINKALKTPVNISGYTFVMTVDSIQSPSTPSTTEKFSVPGVITSAPEGKVSFTPTITNNDLDPGTYYYDVQMVEGVTKRTIVKNTYAITQDVTKV